jgi:hypothetical protein
MTAYATPADLASYLQVASVDTASAQLALDKASALFSVRAGTQFLPTAAVWIIPGTGWTELYIPYRPVISVQTVKISGVTITDYTLIKRTLYRLLGWGVPGKYPPDSIEVDLTHGYAAPPDDVIGAVLETAGSAYQSPDNTVGSESIDDYSVKFTDIGGMMLTPSARELADLYRGTWVI